MSLTSRFVRLIGYPLLLSYRGETEILSHYQTLRRFWRATQSEIDHHRLQRLRALLRHANETSPFYRARLAETGIRVESVRDYAPIKSLPFLTKSDLNANMPKILSTAFRREDLIQSSTGGSSGEPLTFYRDARATAVRRAQDYFFNAQLGIYPGTKRAWVWGSPLDVNRLSSVKARLANFLSERAIYFYSFDAGPEPMTKFLTQLQVHRPKVIFAYPNMLAALAEFAVEHSIAVPAIAKVVTTAEPTYPWQRELYRKVFGAETYERYGSREIGTVAAESLDQSGLYLFEPSYFCEVIDTAGAEVASGQMGELVVTDLYNFAMPLIRYRTGDMVKIIGPEPGSYSRWRRISAVGGRIVDLIVRPDGSRIAGEALIMALRTSGFVDKVQIVQRSPILFTIKHLGSAQISSESRTKLTATVSDLMGRPVTIDYQVVQELSYDPSGKYRYVTNESHDEQHGNAR